MLLVDTGVFLAAADRHEVTTGAVRVVDLTADDYERSVALVEQYADLGLGFVDASIVAVGERLGVVAPATLNHRDFRAVRPSHVAAFDLVP
jgi:predicted nucleic acid-binding protein